MGTNAFAKALNGGARTPIFLVMTRFFLIGRLLQFRKELVTLWRAFGAPQTPLYLKAAMLGVVLYLVSPIDLIPDVVPFLGIVDDIVLVPLMVSWIVSRLPRMAGARAPAAPYRATPGEGPVIDGTARRR
jgi:uncharacterized membrane protein YkvA (DUF1232 family)